MRLADAMTINTLPYEFPTDSTTDLNNKTTHTAADAPVHTAVRHDISVL